MKNITLCRPIVLRSSLNDMSLSQREIAIDLLSSRKLLVPDRDGLKIVEPDAQHGGRLPRFYLYGSEAVCYYRQSLGLPDASIKDIEVDDIVTNTEDFDTLFDILFFLNNVSMRNGRVKKLMDMDAPMVILWNEYRMLQEYVEALQDNNWCGRPAMNRFRVPYEDEAQEDAEWHEQERKSLADIGYSLLRHEPGHEPTAAE